MVATVVDEMIIVEVGLEVVGQMAVLLLLPTLVVGVNVVVGDPDQHTEADSQGILLVLLPLPLLLTLVVLAELTQPRLYTQLRLLPLPLAAALQLLLSLSNAPRSS